MTNVENVSAYGYLRWKLFALDLSSSYLNTGISLPQVAQSAA